MYKTYDAVNGFPPRIYRTPAEIRRDIGEISERIEETAAMVNIRSLLVDILVSERADSPESLIPELEDAVLEARSALEKMHELKEELTSLEEELREVKWLNGIRR